MFLRKKYKVNRFLVRMAIEDAAQEAGRREVTRQINAQLPKGHEVHFNTFVVDCIIDPKTQHINIDGRPVEWTDESI